MAVDKLVDSTQLDADLTSVANAIRTKGGTSAQLAFPADFVSAINAISGGGGAQVTHVKYTTTSDALSSGAGGNTSFFYNTYIAPNIPSGTDYVLISIITNNTATGNYAKAVSVFYSPDINATTKQFRVYYRGNGTGSSNFAYNTGTNYDFLSSSGSVIDVWVMGGVLS